MLIFLLISAAVIFICTDDSKEAMAAEQKRQENEAWVDWLIDSIKDEECTF